MDVKIAFLHVTSDEEMYLAPPAGVQVPDGDVLRLLKSLYGLRQSNKCWNDRFHSFLIKLGFARSPTESCLYWRRTSRGVVLIVIYVDDMLICYNDEEEATQIKTKLAEEFEMKDLGHAKRFMGLEIDPIDGELTINQSLFIEKILEKFWLSDCNPVSTPMDAGLKLQRSDGTDRTENPYRALLGSLMYVMLGSRLDICFALSLLSRFQDSATNEHWNHLKRTLRYLKGTKNLKLTYRRNEVPVIRTFADSDWANDAIDRKSASGFLVQVYGNTVIWSSKKQSIIALSSTEAEYVAACSACCETVWLINTLTDLKFEVARPVAVHEDNQACIMI